MRHALPITLLAALAGGCAQTATGPSARTEAPAAPSSDAVTRAEAETTRAAVEPPARGGRPSPVRFTSASTGLPEEGMWKCHPAFADVNGDGHLDLAAVPRLGSGARVWLGDGAGRWRDSSAGLQRSDAKSCGGGVAFADFNEDGAADLAVADHCDGLFVYLGDGEGGWQPVVQGLGPAELAPSAGRASMFAGAEDVEAGDLDGDGHVDLVVCASDEGGLSVYHGDGTGFSWTRSARGLPQSGWANRVQLVDMNADGVLDVIASYDRGPRVWINDGAASFRHDSEGLPAPMMRGLYQGIAAADFNGDGRMDIAAANWSDGPEVFVREADDTWRQTDDVFPAMRGGAIGLAVGDVDADGREDIVVSGRLDFDAIGFSRGVFLLLGNGAETWQYAEDSALPETGLATTQGVGLCDVNGDGQMDVVACSGLHVETALEGPPEPVAPHHLIVWCGEPSARSAAATVGGTTNSLVKEGGMEGGMEGDN